MTLAAGAAGGAAMLRAQPEKPLPDLPRRMLGRTGVSIPIVGFGSGSRFTNFYTDDAGEAAVRNAIDCGITYLDTAAGYGDGRSETIYGRVMKTRRNEVFLATKNAVRDRDPALRVFEQSLKRLQTDHVDLLHIHNLASSPLKNGRVWVG
ncbi:MAG TPA: aldo/keto reductase [Verrucomicrobiae bacterium]|nr:aldo/keto reductase [Verrucomicrobiae bacterium]